MMWECKKCGTQNEEEQQICQQCGCSKGLASREKAQAGSALFQTKTIVTALYVLGALTAVFGAIATIASFVTSLNPALRGTDITVLFLSWLYNFARMVGGGVALIGLGKILEIIKG